MVVFMVSMPRSLCFLCFLFSFFDFPHASDEPSVPSSVYTERRPDRRQEITIFTCISVFFSILILLLIYIKFIRSKIVEKNKDEEDGEHESKKPNDLNPTDLIAQPIMIYSFKDSIKKFNWEEIVKLTANFSTVIGEGGFSTVFLGLFSDSKLGAVKIYRNSERLYRVFRQELEVVLRLDHENIVKLMGYCDEREKGVLVFEYVCNGSLQEKLHNQDQHKQILPWNRRMTIIYQVARAIEYLHEKCDLQIIHGDVKASNILLDEQLNSKLCDFGFAKVGFSSLLRPSTNPVMGSPGYVDPHYLRSGIITKKNDIYSFGVLILELVTGIEAFYSEKEQLLTSFARPMLNDPRKVSQMVDPGLIGEFDKEEAMCMISISASCLSENPALRPSMVEILNTMKEKVSSVSFSVPQSKDITKTHTQISVPTRQKDEDITRSN